MLSDTVTFINDYCALLADQFNESPDLSVSPSARSAAFHRAIGSWNHHERLRAWDASTDFNEQLQLGIIDSPDFVLRNHVLTTAVGRVNGDFVVITANPGHAGDLKNGGEIAMRDGLQANIDFCSEFFERFPIGVARGLTHSWWRKVFRVARRFLEPPPQWSGMHTPQERWQWAHGHPGGIGCIDLFPFHSTKDKLSYHAIRNGDECAQVLLRQVANASLDMAIRANPGVILIASRLGAQLVAERLWQPIAVAQVENRLLTMYCVNGIPVFVYAVQLFSGTVRGINNATLHGVADSMNEIMSLNAAKCRGPARRVESSELSMHEMSRLSH